MPNGINMPVPQQYQPQQGMDAYRPQPQPSTIMPSPGGVPQPAQGAQPQVQPQPGSTQPVTTPPGTAAPGQLAPGQLAPPQGQPQQRQ
jgi:hypothetical protein